MVSYFGHRRRPMVFRKTTNDSNNRGGDEANAGASTTTTTQRKRPFDAFLTAAFTAVLAVLFVWRIFFFDKKRTPSIEASSSSSSSSSSDGEETVSDMSDNEESKYPIKMPQVGSPESPKASMKSVSTLLETDSLPTSPGRPSTAPPPVPKLASSSEEMEKLGNLETTTETRESPPIVINTFGVQKEIEEARLCELMAQGKAENEEAGEEVGWSPDNQPDIFMFGGPGLIQFVSSTSGPSLDPNAYGGYLDAITEEDSDDLRSQSSASSHHFGSSSAQSSVRAPSADVVEQVDARITTVLGGGKDSEEDSDKETIQEKHEISSQKSEANEDTPVLSRRESGPELLSEAEESLPESENFMFPRITAVAAAAEAEAEQKKMEADRDQAEVIVQSKTHFTHIEPKNDNQNDESRVSSTSVSIEFDNSRDSLLDQSICSNPRDETAILAHFAAPNTMEHREGAKAKEEKPDDSFDEDNLPPPPLPSVPPPPLNESTESSDGPPPPPEVLRKHNEMESHEIVTTKPDESLKEANKPEPEEIVIDATEDDQTKEAEKKVEEENKIHEEKQSEEIKEPERSKTIADSKSKPTGDLSSPERLSSLLYGYDSGGLTPLGWQYRKTSPDEANKENSTKTTTSTTYKFGDPVSSVLSRPMLTDSSYYSSTPMYTVEERTTFKRETFGNPYDVDLERSSRRLARYGQTYADAPLSYMSNADAKEMNVPHSEVPPHLSQPQTQRTTYAESTGYRTDADTSRDDLMSDAGRRSRATVREIPVQRSQSAFSYSRAPTTTNGSMLDFKTPGAGGTGWTTTRYEAGNPAGEEYYRREVMTRTLVTRSTEALSQQPLPVAPPPIDVFRHLPEPRDEVTHEYITKYSRSVEEEERRIRESQERRRQDEEERRRREEEIRRRFEQEENERLAKIRMERARIEKDLEEQILARERMERERIEKERIEREEIERRRRAEWDRLENERRAIEEQELARRRELERIEKERLERERLEVERLERERLARERLELERFEKERIERERIERERIEIERLEIERIERIKREQIAREQREREREKLELERLERERLEAERLERERIEKERLEREIIEQQRREAEQRERERRQDEMREALRREQEARERELIEKAEREAGERERQRRIQEKLEWDRLERLRLEQERLEREKEEAVRRERERLEEERRELELLEAKVTADKRREQERLEEERRERERQEQEKRERDKRERERFEAAERERLRRLEEQREQERLAELERNAAERRALQAMEGQRAREREQLELERQRLMDIEKLEADRREKERDDSRLLEERRLAELREQERRNASLREQERREAAEREAGRQRDDRRSRERLDLIVKEREDREKMEWERRRHLAEKEAEHKRRKDLTSKETLERLTRKPYYSRENLSQPEVTTKVERQVIERVDRTLYTDGVPLSSTSYYAGGGTSINPPLSLEAPSDDFGLGRDRLFQSRNNDLRDSQRANRYKSRTDKDKARRDFFSADSSQNDALERLRRSNEDLARRIEYRGPLLSKFNSSDMPSRPLESAYPSVGPSPYDKEFRELFEKAERQLAHYRKRTHSAGPPSSRQRYWSTTSGKALDSSNYPKQSIMEPPTLQRQPLESEEINRSKSVLDYNSTITTQQQESSSRRGWYSPRAEGNHSRSKSADMLMDQKARETAAAPENELQKQGTEDTTNVSEYEHRFRKSVEKMQVPDWYRDYSTRQQTSSTRYDLPPSQPWSYTNPPLSSQHQQHHHQQSTSPPVGGISFPAGMFDKYKDEIEDMRRSRTSLHQIGQPQEHTKGGSRSGVGANGGDLLIPSGTAAITREVSQETLLRRKETITSSGGKHLPGYTVSTIPTDWNLGKDANSRVIEVADTFIGKQTQETHKVLRYGGRVTVEEVLDGIFQQTKPSDIPSDPSLPQSDRPPTENIDGPGIYTSNYMLMDKVLLQPHLAEDLLNREQLFVRCGRCHKTKGIREARGHFVSCKHCYTYYCSRQCRQWDWEKHRERCSFARINTLCKEVIMKVRQEAETQYHMSRVARDGYKNYGRGSVNIRLHSAHAAQQYLEKGWRAFETMDHSKLLFYYPVQALVDLGKEQSLITLCRKYNPSDKFILSVSIIADIEYCPETPPPEPYPHQQQQHQQYHQQSHHKSPYTQTADMYSALVPTDV